MEARSKAFAALVSEVASDWYGAVSPSVYDTGRVVTLAPWLGGHRQRLRFLVGSQHRDGRWGGMEGYGLVPTLSATEALLSSLWSWPGGRGDVEYGEMARAADRGLRVLFGWLGAGSRVLIPDTVAVEIIVPALIEQVNRHLGRLEREPALGLDSWCGSGRLVLPRWGDAGLLARLRHTVACGQALPARLWHSLEAIGPMPQSASFIHPVAGAVGCSPAATAAWLGDRSDHAAVRYLEAVQRRGGGPVPGVTPITVFERVWVLAAYAATGVEMRLPPGLVGSLHAAFSEMGVAAGAGLPPDSDDTAGALWILAQLGCPRSTQSLWSYHADAYFRCFLGERTPSTSTNAHVLQAFGASLKYDEPERDRHHLATDMISKWLRDRQEAEGNWWDKWHASPYYATACCTISLFRYSRDTSTAAVDRSVRWLLDSQREDGSWGRWDGTYEETAYAMQILLQTVRDRTDNVIEHAAARGCSFLQQWVDHQEHPPLWHDKDLYTPIRVVRAEGLAALHLAYANPRVASRVDHRPLEEPGHAGRDEVS